jgi:hypothetical protein
MLQNGTEMVPIWYQNDAKTVPKWYQNGTILVPHYGQTVGARIFAPECMLSSWFQFRGGSETCPYIHAYDAVLNF